MITARAGQTDSHSSCKALAVMRARPQQSPQPHSQHPDFTTRRRRESANQPLRIRRVCGGRVVGSARWTAGKWRQTQIELGCACLPAVEGSAHCCCAAFWPRLHECHPVHFLTPLLLCVRRKFVHGSIFTTAGPRWLYGGLQVYAARRVQIAGGGAAQ